ncbi:MAG: hypothetical protein KBI40_03785 [Firmicutes bacterium]|nr:hypothetical protein [Candidatus Fermentithermobacillaceae bacterium]
MARKELDLILEAEKKAEDEIEQARQTAQRILEDAATKSDQMIGSITKEAENKAREIIAKAKRNADLIADSSAKNAEAEIEKMKNEAMSRFEEAVGLVVERVKKAV